MGADLTEEQRDYLAIASAAQVQGQWNEGVLSNAVKAAVAAGVPILTLANALGVSRSRIRRLAR